MAWLWGAAVCSLWLCCTTHPCPPADPTEAEHSCRAEGHPQGPASTGDVPWLGSSSPCPHLCVWGFLPTLMPGSETCLTQGYSGGMQPWTPGKCPYLCHSTKLGSFKLMFVSSSKYCDIIKENQNIHPPLFACFFFLQKNH